MKFGCLFFQGYALIEYETYKEALQALQGANGKVVLEEKLSVDWAFVKGPRKT